MDWLVLSYSLPTGPNSSPRVTLWRRLRRAGAITVSGGAYLLPAREQCREAFQWLAQEIRQAQGEALILHVSQVERLGDAEVIQLFHAARRKEYGELHTQAVTLEEQIAGDQLSRATALAPPSPLPTVTPAALAAYQGRRWATRPRPHMDRLACAWPIRRFIDPAATIST